MGTHLLCVGKSHELCMELPNQELIPFVGSNKDQGKHELLDTSKKLSLWEFSYLYLITFPFLLASLRLCDLPSQSSLLGQLIALDLGCKTLLHQRQKHLAKPQCTFQIVSCIGFDMYSLEAISFKLPSPPLLGIIDPAVVLSSKSQKPCATMHMGT